MHLRRIAQHCSCAGVQSGMDRDAGRKPRRQQVERFTYDGFDMDGDALAHAAATEREYAVDQRAPALTCRNDAVQIAAQAAAFSRAAKRHLAVSENGAKNVVE